MYQVEYSDSVLAHIEHSEEMIEALESLADNPMGNSLSTGYPALGSYYIPAGNKAILFNINEAEELITIVSIRRKKYIENLIAKKFD